MDVTCTKIDKTLNIEPSESAHFQGGILTRAQLKWSRLGREMPQIGPPPHVHCILANGDEEIRYL